jgi:hypothetical protein
MVRVFSKCRIMGHVNLAIPMITCGAVDRIPHLRELPFRDAALVVDEVVIELDAESGPSRLPFSRMLPAAIKNGFLM